MSARFTHPQAPAASAPIAVEAATARSIDFLEAMIAAGVMMAYADGEMAATERRRLLLLVRESAMLASFSHEQIVEELALHEANFAFDPEVAQEMAREKLAPLAGAPHRARVIVDACRRILSADGVAHPAEYRALGEIADHLGLADPALGGPLRRA